MCAVNEFKHFFHIPYFYSTTNNEIVQIKNQNILSSLDPPNQGRLKSKINSCLGKEE